MGYQWGGILCGFDIPISGNYSVCDVDNRTRSSLIRNTDYTWVSSKNGIVELSKMILGGQNRNNVPLYLCRAEFNGGVHPGKIQPEFRGCNIPYGGKEHTVFEYDVLIK